MKEYKEKNKEQQGKETIFTRVKKDLLLVRVPLVVLLVYGIVTELLFHAVCPSAILFGRPCSGCGLTRAGILVLTGHFAQAAQMHVMIFFWMFLAVYAAFFRYVLGKRPPLLITLAILVSVATLGYYLYRRQLGTLPEVEYEGLLFYARRFLMHDSAK